MNKASHKLVFFLQTVMYARLAMCRKIFAVFAVMIWLWFAYSYQDINQINNKLLMEIQKQNSDLKLLLQGQGTAGSACFIIYYYSRKILCSMNV